MNDSISREEAIRWVKAECNPYGKPTLEFESGKKVIEHLKQMPSALPERKSGEWIDYAEYGYVECPFCHSATNCDGNKDEIHFCFSCGAYMRREPRLHITEDKPE